jgi:hypothetical protein
MLEALTFQEFYDCGLHAIPVVFNVETREAIGYPKHVDDTRDKDGVPYMEDVIRWLQDMQNVNGVAIKLHPPFGMFDFDLKNTNNKAVYQEWFNVIVATKDDLLKKICIESTRSGGYHVYIKYSKLDHKIPVARSEGKEVISVYTGGLLSFCYPSPGYNLLHNNFNDLDELTDDEFDLMVSTAAMFNEDKDHVPGEKTVALIEYPQEYENICLQFDEKITDDAFETLINSINLERLKDLSRYKRAKYVPFLRKGSTANYSAKVYFKSRRLLIFSASMQGYPTWHDSEKAGDNSWSLSPSKIVYYKNKKDWTACIEEIQMIADSIGIELVPLTPVSKMPIIPEDRLKFPYDVFPSALHNYITPQVVQHEYIAAALLVAAAAAIGNTAYLEPMDGYIVKSMLYMAIIAPPGASKTPALKKAFSAIEDEDDRKFKQYAKTLAEYKEEHAAWKRTKDANSPEPQKPGMPQILIKDSTIEMVVKILTHNSLGCCVLADELSGFLNRMNQYKAGDEVQKWLEMWSGAPILIQRITRDENKVQDPFCCVVGGIQPGVLERLSKEENEHNGFFHRFLFCYPTPQPKTAWQKINIPGPVKSDFASFFFDMFELRGEQVKYELCRNAEELYKEWFDYKNLKYNNATSDHVKGIIAKYQDYCLRFALLIQVMHDGRYRVGLVFRETMERAIRLTEYFLGNMQKAIKILVPESPVDKLQGQQADLYQKLPNSFTTKTAMDLGREIKMKDSMIKMFLQRGIKVLFNKLDHGSYEKIF